MRIALIAATLSLAPLASCGGPQESQANDAQANISTENRIPATAAASSAVAAAKPVTAEEAKKVMHDRHEAMEDIGKATKTAGRELKANTPNLEAIRASAKTINDLAPDVGTMFPQGSGPDVGKTGAKAEIWANPQDFAAKMADFQKAAQAFNAAAARTDMAAIKKSFGDLGGSCKGCHEKYRKEMKH